MLAPSGGVMDPCSRRPAVLWTHAPALRRRYGPMLPPSGRVMDPCSRRPAALWTHAPAIRRRYGPMLGPSGGEEDQVGPNRLGPPLSGVAGRRPLVELGQSKRTPKRPPVSSASVSLTSMK